MVDECLEQYFLASLPGKNDIIDNIVRRVHEDGGRFLRRLAGKPDVASGSSSSKSGKALVLWEEVSADEGRKKVSRKEHGALSLRSNWRNIIHALKVRHPP